jgi:hypothetical protein
MLRGGPTCFTAVYHRITYKLHSRESVMGGPDNVLSAVAKPIEAAQMPGR